MIHADVDLEEVIEAGTATTTVTTNQTADENETFLGIQCILTHLQTHIIEKLISTLKDTDKANKIDDILDRHIIDGTLNTKNRKTYRDLLKDNFDIDRVMRIERKDDLYSTGYAIEDFSARTMNQLLELGKRDALDKLIRSLCHVVANLQKRIFDEGERPPVAREEAEAESQRMSEIKNTLSSHLDQAKKMLKENYDYHKGVIDHLHNFADEVDKMESEGRLSHNKANLLRP